MYTTKELDYNTYLNMGGLQLDFKINAVDNKKIHTLSKIKNTSPLQKEILKSWLGN